MELVEQKKLSSYTHKKLKTNQIGFQLFKKN